LGINLGQQACQRWLLGLLTSIARPVDQG